MEAETIADGIRQDQWHASPPPNAWNAAMMLLWCQALVTPLRDFAPAYF